jgi:PAS domain S-box-containing protein
MTTSEPSPGGREVNAAARPGSSLDPAASLAGGRKTLLALLADRLRFATGPAEIRAIASRVLGEHLRVSRVLYGEIVEDLAIVSEDYVDGVESLVGRRWSDAFGPALTRLPRGDVALVHDVQADPTVSADERAIYEHIGVAAHITCGVENGGRLVAVLSVHSAVPRAWTPEDRTLVRAVAECTWEALVNAQAEADRRQSEARFRNLFEHVASGIVIARLNGQIEECNPALAALVARAPGQLRGIAFAELVHPADRDALAVEMARLQTGETDEVRLEHRYVPRDGAPLWVQTEARIERDRAGRPIRMIGVSTDISERKQVERQLNQELALSHSALEARAAELEQRTLQLARLASDLTLAEQRAREQLAQTLHDGVQQLLVGVTLQLDRLAATERSTGDRPRDLVDLARQGISEAVAAARSLSVELYPPVLHERNLAAALAWLASWVQRTYGLVVVLSVDERADPGAKDVRTLLFESTRELLFNAVKHAKVDRVTLDLALEADNGICITLTDAGVGFDAAAIFGPTSRPGSGLGLFSVRERLMLLGGRLDVESEVGRGTRFTMRAPRGADRRRGARRTLNVVVQREPSSGPVGDQRRTRAVRVLVADDHLVVRRGLRDVLGDCPAIQVVGEASDGLEAIRLAHQLNPDVILMDDRMPDLDGVEATRRIRAALPRVQVVGFSSNVAAGATPPILAAGAAAFVTKGEPAQRLIDRVLAVHDAATGGADVSS